MSSAATKYGRKLHELDCGCRGCGGRAAWMRRKILHETLKKLDDENDRNKFRDMALGNVERWALAGGETTRQAAESTDDAGGGPAGTGAEKVIKTKFRVEKGDWGDVTSMVTKEHGKVFAVLNMANAHVAGGGYVEGMPAQEENMFRRTDCHYFVTSPDFNQAQDRYTPEKTALLNATDGRVFLDVTTARVCIRGSEDRQDQATFGYPWLPEEEYFPFYELRAAAEDLRYGGGFSPESCRKRVAAQLDTLIEKGVKHAVLSAFGCGAFLNPADQVAAVYREELEKRSAEFECVTFAIFYPGYGPDNYTPFLDAFA